MTSIAANLDVDSAPVENSIRRTPLRRQNRGDRAFLGLLTLAGLVTPLLLLVFLAVLVYGAWPSIRTFGLWFLVRNVWEPNPVREQYGALAFILGTLVSSVLALLLTAPVGIGVAAFINEVMPARLGSAFRFVIEVLATIPSVVYGLWGIFVMAPWVRAWLEPGHENPLIRLPFFAEPHDPRNLLCAVLILSIMILPVIVSVSLDAMRMVPSSYREAALGLGATRWEMIRLAVLPVSRSGLSGACILALGRALGETMAVTMVIGNSHTLRWSVFAASDTIASTIANQFAESPSDLFTSALIELALLLFLVTLAVNVVARSLVKHMVVKTGGAL